MKKPNFFIVGVAKAATSSLYQYIGQHPDIFISPIKEPDYFASTFVSASGNTVAENIKMFNKSQKVVFLNAYNRFCESGDIEERDLIFVRDNIMIKNKEAYLSLFRNVKEEKIIAEASTSYLFYDGVAEKIYNFSPDARILISLRDPVERALSAYTFMVFRMFENLSFEKALIVEDERLKQGYPHIYAYKMQGLYYEKVKKYLDIFGSKRVKIVWGEDLKSNLMDVIYEIFDFLGLGKIEVDVGVKSNISGIPRFIKLYEQLIKIVYKKNLKKILKSFIPFKTREKILNIFKGKKPDIKPKIIKELCDFYREDIKKLSELTGKKLTHWANYEG